MHDETVVEVRYLNRTVDTVCETWRADLHSPTTKARGTAMSLVNGHQRRP